MTDNNYYIDDLFKHHAEDYRIESTASDFKRFKKRLFKFNFFRFNPRTLNIYYLGTAVILTITALGWNFLREDPGMDKKEMNEKVIQTDSSRTQEKEKAIQLHPDSLQRDTSSSKTEHLKEEDKKPLAKKKQQQPTKEKKAVQKKSSQKDTVRVTVHDTTVKRVKVQVNRDTNTHEE